MVLLLLRIRMTQVCLQSLPNETVQRIRHRDNSPLRDSVQNPQAVVTPTNIPYQINWRGLCSRRNPRYTPTLLAVPPPKSLSLRSGEAYT